MTSIWPPHRAKYIRIHKILSAIWLNITLKSQVEFSRTGEGKSGGSCPCPTPPPPLAVYGSACNWAEISKHNQQLYIVNSGWLELLEIISPPRIECQIASIPRCLAILYTCFLVTYSTGLCCCHPTTLQTTTNTRKL